MRIAKYLLEQHTVLIWSFFFGLIIASIYFVGKQIKKWSKAKKEALINDEFEKLPNLAKKKFK